MDSIVKKLAEIETAASAIVEHAEAQKEILDQEYTQKRKKFDEKLEADTQIQIKKIKEDLEQDTSQLLNSQTGASSDSIEILKKEYEEKHTIYAQGILKRITEV